ncbi:unnamed protein product [Mucor fragilis]
MWSRIRFDLVNKRCPLCSKEVFGTTKEHQFIRMYFSTDNSDEKAINQLNIKINTMPKEMQKLQDQTREHNALKQQHIEAKEENQRTRELISLLHEKFNILKVELSMAKMALKKN